jgi:N utilization substance protein B
VGRRAGSRRQARNYALQALYHADLSGVAAQVALNNLWQALMDGEGIEGERAPESEEVEFSQALVRGVTERQEEIDTLIERCSTNWRLRRMPMVDRNILRLAAYELMARTDIPATVSVNEAVELAKRFGTAESRAFVNGIVDRIGRQLERLPERGRGRGRRR